MHSLTTIGTDNYKRMIGDSLIFKSTYQAQIKGTNGTWSFKKETNSYKMNFLYSIGIKSYKCILR